MNDAVRHRLTVVGKFFSSAGQRVFIKCVTFGPFPDPQPDPASELAEVRSAGFNAIRIYGDPSDELLDAALANGLWVFVGVSWPWQDDFLRSKSSWLEVREQFKKSLLRWGKHQAVAAVYVANELNSDLARWLEVHRCVNALQELIELGRELMPHLLFAYSNYPTSEFLEPSNADFTAYNIYLEDRGDFAGYLPRLHHLAGDRPVLISEVGMDTQRHAESEQSELLCWQLEECLLAGLAGTTVYAWSDRWFNGGRVVDDWSFGLKRRDGSAKPALADLTAQLKKVDGPEAGLDRYPKAYWPKISVIVCVHNGAHRMKACLQALSQLDYAKYEVIVVDDGSQDNIEQVVGEFSKVRLIRQPHAGLSAARNLGASKAKGEIFAYTDDDCEPDPAWLKWIAHGFNQLDWDACGGPNLPPAAENEAQAIVASAPGGPSHVMLDDVEAEHLPGCNLCVRRDAFEAIGGFDSIYWVAGDDVDFCWRLREAGYQLGFSGAAFVWHHRRTSLYRYLKQQRGYGRAEALLMREHPERFRRNQGASWEGVIYTGAAMSSVNHLGSMDADAVIYHGIVGAEPYQQLHRYVMPMRPLAAGHNGRKSQLKLQLVSWAQQKIRRWTRHWHSRKFRSQLELADPVVLAEPQEKYRTVDSQLAVPAGMSREQFFSRMQEIGWVRPERAQLWDLEKSSTGALLCWLPNQPDVVQVRFFLALGKDHFTSHKEMVSALSTSA